MIKKRIAIVLAVASMAALVLAQPGQPRGKAETTINGKKVVIEYGRPALKGRTLDELMSKLPEDRIWRAGENQVTTLETGTALNIGGKTVPPGRYSLYVHAPASGDWALVVNKDLGVPLGEIWAEAPDNMKKEPWPRLDGYGKISKDEVARIKLNKAAGKGAELFTIDLQPEKIELSWGDASYSTTIKAAS